jgi:hypothetical protein
VPALGQHNRRPEAHAEGDGVVAAVDGQRHGLAGDRRGTGLLAHIEQSPCKRRGSDGSVAIRAVFGTQQPGREPDGVAWVLLDLARQLVGEREIGGPGRRHVAFFNRRGTHDS